MNKETKVEEINTNNSSDSIWSHLKYGLGMTAIIAIPPLIPGVTMKALIMGYMALINIVYLACAISEVMKTILPTKPAQRGSYIRRHT